MRQSSCNMSGFTGLANPMVKCDTMLVETVLSENRAASYIYTRQRWFGNISDAGYT